MADVELSVENGIGTILLNRPDSLNSLSSLVLQQLGEAVSWLEQDRDIRAALVTGAGRAFVAGADIEEISKLDPQSGRSFAHLGQQVFDRIEKLDKPVIAAVNGFALGGGCELAMACHMRVASTRAKFGQPEIKLGILPGFGGSQRLPRLVPRGIATKLLLTGEIIKADEALRIGLVDELVEPDEVVPRARAILEAILANGPRAIGLNLSAIRDGLSVDLERGLEVELNLFAEACGTDEMKEGTAAFLEKRDPDWPKS